MENIPILGQTSQLLASGIILLALCLGIIFYFWSLNLFKKIELLINRMRKNIDNLEKLSQSIYETAYFELKKNSKNTTQKQTRVSQKDDQQFHKEPEEQKIFSSNPKSTQFSQSEEKDKYQHISELITRYFRDLLKSKEQVTAQELIYAMPNQYSLADIYRALEEMKEKNLISWEDKNVSPQSILKMN
jgi:hypothetical protein